LKWQTVSKFHPICIHIYPHTLGTNEGREMELYNVSY
jgi:hypothetical protein